MIRLERARATGRVALALLMLASIGVPAAASLDGARRVSPGSPTSALDALAGVAELHDETGAIAAQVRKLVRRVDQARVAITTMRGGIRADHARLKEKQRRALARAADVGLAAAPIEPVEPVEPVDPIETGDPADPADPAEPAAPVDPVDGETAEIIDPAGPPDPVDPDEPLDGADPAPPVDRDDFLEALRQGERSETLLAAEIRYQDYQSEVMRHRLDDLTNELRLLGFELGRRQKNLEMKLALARAALYRSRSSAPVLREPLDGTVNPASFPGLESISRADAEATIARISRAHEHLWVRRRHLNGIQSELDTTESALARHRNRLQEARDGAGSLLATIRSDSAFLFPHAGPASVTTGGACERSIHSSIRLSDAQIADHARDAGFRGFDLSMAVAISLAESGGDPQAVCVNYSGTSDEGLWQINSMHGKPRSCTFDPACAADVAYRLYTRRGRSFEDWTVFNSGTVSGLIPRAALAALLLGEDPFAIFEVCPVDAPRSYSNDWGAPRGGGTRTHQGNDVFAARGTPVRAPFPGTAVAADNGLGGKSVSVYGARGHVYNAHLSRYGRLGSVRPGQIIGYVGTTGNAVGTSPHNHFQWHPADGLPINPYPYLNTVCL